MTSTTSAWLNALGMLIVQGEPVSPLSPGAAWRGRASREIRGYQTIIRMETPVVMSPMRKLGFKFLAAEAAWILSGDNKVSTIAPYAKNISAMSDDGLRFFGAYGTKFVDQLSFVVDCLVKDPASRQAVINIWREQPRQSKDTPCTLSLQFLLRDGKLHCVATMRSSDIWMGWVYDVFNFSMMSAMVALELRERIKTLKNMDALETLRPLETNISLGHLYLTAGSQHLYEADVENAKDCLANPKFMCMDPLNLAEFANAEQLVDHLWACARGNWSMSPPDFLGELYA